MVFARITLTASVRFKGTSYESSHELLIVDGAIISSPYSVVGIVKSGSRYSFDWISVYFIGCYFRSTQWLITFGVNKKQIVDFLDGGI